MESHTLASKGFAEIDHAGGDTGLDIKDLLLKFKYAPEGSAHSLHFNLAAVDQDSEQTYMGLTRADYAANPHRRYLASSQDLFASERDSWNFAYKYRFSEDLKLVARLYHARYSRNWYKSEGIDFDGSASAGEFRRTRWSSVVAAVDNATAIGTNTAAMLQAILNGGDTPEGAIELRHNNRAYISKGSEFLLTRKFKGSQRHMLTAGVRLHKDHESRLQHIETWRQLNSTMLRNHVGAPGSAGNRLESAEALAVYITDTMTLGRTELTVGLRYEDVERERKRWRENSADPASRAPENFRDIRRNAFDVLLPGAGVRVDLGGGLALIGSVYRGYTAASSDPASKIEKSWNYELGVRYDAGGATRWDIIAFVNDYDNLIGFCTASSGTDCGEAGDPFNAQGVKIKGIEANYESSTILSSGLELAWGGNATYLDTAFDASFRSALFGVVYAGDDLPFQPSLQGSVLASLIAPRWEVSATLSHTGKTCATAACAVREEIPAITTLDSAFSYNLRDNLHLHIHAENLLDDDTIATVFPYGARPIKPRVITAGVKWEF